jgi:hypothetical protein
MNKHQLADQLPITEQSVEDDGSNEDDDQINESLFLHYDHMLNLYNTFGAKFQETAHYIG